MDIDKKQFGFIPRCGTTNVIFILKQLQEKYLAIKNLYVVFIDLEKAFDGIPRDNVRWALGRLGIEELLVKNIQSMYKNG